MIKTKLNLFKINKWTVQKRFLTTTKNLRSSFDHKENEQYLVAEFPIPNQVTQYEAKYIPFDLLKDYYNYPIARDPLHVQNPGYWFGRKFIPVPEMEPQLIVPDLTDFKLKPYVSHRAPDIQQSEFTARALFNKTYANEIVDKYLKKEEIKITVNDEEIANSILKAKQTGSDLLSATGDELYEKDCGPREPDVFV